ncbi:MAG: RuBisCO large subunit C-terminal-like domain-containing protein [Hespellia sp.]|nr:RuBisCO large subunit C-terminal-like domain-containing protein [Hespellia sp.]
MKYDPNIFKISESIDREKFIICTYFAEGFTSDLLNKVGAMAIEQTTGTWAPVPLETPEVRRRHGGKVIAVHEIPAYEFDMPEAAGKERMAVFQIAFPYENMGSNLPQVLTSVIGNISMAGKLKLLDIDFPKVFTDGFQGPRFGVEGLREMCNVPKRPFIVSMIKPCTGATAENAGKLIRELAMAGIDWIKDDELFSDTEYCTVKARVKVASEILKDVYERTGKKVIYSPNISDRPDRMLDKAKLCKEYNIPGLMINALTTGWPAMQMIAENDDIALPILAHPAFAGAMYESAYSGISSHLVLGKFMRMCGADIVIYPCAYGKVDIKRERYIRIAQSLTTELHGMKRTFPGPAAGVYQGLIPDVAEDLGMDFSISAGAAMHAHPMGAAAGVESLLRAAEATAEGIPLQEAAKDCPSLQAAIDAWGIGLNQEMFDLKK